MIRRVFHTANVVVYTGFCAAFRQRALASKKVDTQPRDYPRRAAQAVVNHENLSAFADLKHSRNVSLIPAGNRDGHSRSHSGRSIAVRSQRLRFLFADANIQIGRADIHVAHN